MSRGSRWVLIAFLLLFAWMVLADWRTDTPKQHVGDVLVAGFMLVFAIGLAAPTRFLWALRLTAGTVFVAYAIYFATQLVRLLHGEYQPLAPNRPSATTAGLGLLLYGVPALVFALGAERVGLGRLFRTRADSDDRHIDNDTSAAHIDLDQHSNER